MRNFSPDTELSPEALQAALTHCETEPFLSPGSIQPHGFLLSLAPDNGCILQASVNCGPWLGMAPETLPGRRLESLPGGEALAALRQRAGQFASGRACEALTLTVDGEPRPYWASLHRCDGAQVLELEPRVLEASMLAALPAESREVLDELEATDTFQATADLLVRRLRALCGFEQAVIYRFIEEGHGTVVAEDREAHMPAYLGLRFPASDVPFQVRAHARRQRIRAVADLYCQPVALLPGVNPLSGEPLVQASCELRMPHYWAVKYYRNMGVRAVLALSLVDGERLWGYVCLLHRTPRYLDPQRRLQAEQLVRQTGAWLVSRQTHEQQAHYQGKRMRLDRLLVSLLRTQRDAWEEPTLVAEAMGFLEADGLAVCVDDIHRAFGTSPPAAQCRMLLAWLRERREPIYLYHRLAEDYPGAAALDGTVAGLAAMALDQEGHNWLLWFRVAQRHTVDWAGEPRKQFQAGADGQPLLTPRDSFQRWSETVEGASRLFSDADRALLEDLHRRLASHRRPAAAPSTPFWSPSLREDRARLDELLRAVHEVVWYLELPALTTSYVSPPVLRLTGYPPQAFVDRPSLWLAVIHPEDRDRVHQLLTGLGAGSTYRTEYRLLHRDGDIRWVQERGKVLSDASGRALRIDSILIDISDRRRLEQELQMSNRLLERAGELARLGGWEVDLETMTPHWSPGVYRIHEVAEGTPVDLARALDHYPGEARQIMAGAVQRAVEHGERFDLQLPFVTARGNRLWVRTIGEPECHGGCTRRLYGVLQDITEQRRNEEALQAARVEAERASRAKSRFLANMSHEIRTPMNAIVGFSEILARELADQPRYRSYLNGLGSGARNLLQLLNDILDFSRIEAEQLELRPSATDLPELLAEVRHLFELAARQKGLSLRLDYHTPLPAVVSVDALRLRQILVNLMGNAVKFTRSGGVALLVRAQPHGAEPGRVDLHLTVSDTGPGIEPAMQERIFEVFQQGEGSEIHQSGGSGLGLSITRRLVELLGGSLDLDSAPGQGARFSVHLPGLAVLADQPSMAGAEDTAIRFAPATVMVADDAVSHREVLRAYLADQPLTLLEADDGERLLALLAEYRPALILLDLRMPRLDGFGVLARLRAEPDWRDIPVVVLSASAASETDGKTLAGCAGFLQKPFGIRELFALLGRFLPTEASARLPAAADPGPALPGGELAPALRALLVAEWLPRFQALRAHRTLGRIGEFARELRALAEQWQATPLIDYADALLADVEARRVVQLGRLLDAFPVLLGETGESDAAG